MAVSAEDAAVELEGLYARCHASALGWAQRRLGSRAMAEDAVQDAFVQIFSSLSRGNHQLLEGGASVVHRNVRWATHKLIEHDRASDARERRYCAVGLSEEEAWIRHEVVQLLDSILSHLPGASREVLRLRYLEGRSDKDCARHLGITVEAFRVGDQMMGPPTTR